MGICKVKHPCRKFFGASRMPPTPLREVFAKFSRKFFENVGAKFFSKSRSRRRDQFGPKIVKIRAILAIFRPFEVLGCQKNRIFGRPFTPRGWLRSASNFGKTCFRRLPTFQFLTPKTSKKFEFLQNFEQPLIPRGWLCSASNFGQARFR